MKFLLAILFALLLAVSVASAQPETCNLPPLSAGVLTTWNAAAMTITDTVLTSDQVTAWLAVDVTPTTDNYYEQRDHGQVLYRVVAPYDAADANVTAWVIVSWRTGKYYLIIADMGVLGSDGYPHPCAWGEVRYADLPIK